MKILDTYRPEDTEKWLKLRLAGIGGSDVAGIMGDDPWRSAYDVWYDRMIPRDYSSAEFNEAAYWGNVLEPVVAQEFQNRSGLVVVPLSAVVQHQRYPFMLATVDRLVYTPADLDDPRNTDPTPDGVLEIKTRSSYAEKEWQLGVPKKVWWQLQHYLEVCDLPQGWVAVLIGGQKLIYYTVDRDRGAGEQLVNACHDLWQHVLDKTPPPLTASVESVERITSAYPSAAKGNFVELNKEARAAYYKLRAHKLKIEKLTAAEKDDLELRIKAALEVSEYGHIDGKQVVRWSDVTQSRIDIDKLKKEHPIIAEAVTVRSSYRKLTIMEEPD